MRPTFELLNLFLVVGQERVQVDDGHGVFALAHFDLVDFDLPADETHSLYLDSWTPKDTRLELILFSPVFLGLREDLTFPGC